MKTYPLFKVHVDIDKAVENLTVVLKSGFINEGEHVTELTQKLGSYLQARNCCLVNSCTSALQLALRLAGVGPGDEVISTPMTCVATNAAIAATGAKIVWADIDAAHGMLNVEDVCKKVTEKTKAVMAVAWAGCPPNLFDLSMMCKGLGLKLVLDAAHAFGAAYGDVPIHEWADYTCYSFQAIKHFSTGDGGMLVCASKEDNDRAKALKWFGLDRDKSKDAKGNWKGQQWDVDIAEIGYKFNMNNMAAAIGLSQLGHIDDILERHRANARIYDRLFVLHDTKVVPNDRPTGAKSSHWVYGVRLTQRCRLTRDELLGLLNAESIMAGVVHVPNDAYTCFNAAQDPNLPGLAEFSAKQFNLPCGWWLDADDIGHIFRRVMELAQ